MNNDRWKLTESDIKKMIISYRNGMSKSDIGREFKIHHSTVIYHINKNGVPPPDRTIYTHIRGRKKPIVPSDRYDADGSKINNGSNYEEYLDRAEVRRREAQEHCPHQECIHTIRCKKCGIVLTDAVTFIQ